jgi:uncharacterized protein YPO0396
MSTRATTNSTPLPPGFRLHRLEVRNWGTFDGKIHILDPLGKTALLIGENGSGKSTLVDALLTLLVPRTKRNYNMSSGAVKKRERDERTYVLGAYGSESGSEENRAQIKFLRKKPGAPPTILLACFLNDATGEAVSLGQILWVQDDDVRKLFLIARSARSIQGDFGGLQESKSWKKALKQRGFEVEDSFNDYAEKAVRHLKMESTTTLALFSQTVAIKEITHVSTFIRDHMLERLDTRELMERLEQHYEDLTKCWDAIQRARKQLDLLQPVADKAAEIKTHQVELDAATRFNEALAACFAKRLKLLLETELTSLAEAITSLEREIADLGQQLERLEKDKFSIQQAIDNDEVGKQLAKVQEELEEANSQENNRRALSTRYHNALKELGIVDEVTEEQRFLERQAWAESEREAQTEIINTSAVEVATAGEQLKQLKSKADELERELNSLRNRPDLIPEGDRQLRELIARGAGISVAELPFAGELMDVREEQSAQWRGALERLLRGFGLSILVPEQIYSRVNRFINDHNLRRRVVYHRVPAQVSQMSRGSDQGRVIEKMKLKGEHPLAAWVEAELRNQFNHRCCENLDEFERVSGFAITRQGLIRSGGTRHVKDDGVDINDARYHILGWSNLDKIRRLEESLAEIQKTAQAQAVLVSQAQVRQQKATKRADQTGKLVGFRTFSEIDWRSAAKRKVELQARQQELEESSNQIRQLQEQLKILKGNIATLATRKTAAIENKGGFQSKREGYETQLGQCGDTLQTCQEPDLTIFDERLNALLQALQCPELNIADASITQHKASSNLGKEMLAIQAKRDDVAKAATKFMQGFLSEFADMKTDLSADERYLPEFLKLRESIKADDLPRHEERFRELMSRDVLAHVASFQDKLETHCEEIQSKVGNLNDALRGIAYSPKTYITIRASYSNDPEIRDFRNRLKGCLEFGLNADAAARESAFRRISDLINRIREKPDWAAKVTDTRTWLTFAVEELRREDNKQENFYSDTGGKSGGQKAKLAFTILASAIAYQYGIAKDSANPNSFRFVVVDEMFARSDEANSKYALQLFAKFQLQLLIVCPFDARARVVEPFVSSYHLSLNPTTQASTVRTITVDEIHERLAKLPAVPQTHAHT